MYIEVVGVFECSIDLIRVEFKWKRMLGVMRTGSAGNEHNSTPNLKMHISDRNLQRIKYKHSSINTNYNCS